MHGLLYWAWSEMLPQARGALLLEKGGGAAQPLALPL